MKMSKMKTVTKYRKNLRVISTSYRGLTKARIKKIAKYYKKKYNLTVDPLTHNNPYGVDLISDDSNVFVFGMSSVIPSTQKMLTIWWAK